MNVTPHVFHDDRVPPVWGFYTRVEGDQAVACTVRLQFAHELQACCPWLCEIEVNMLYPGPHGTGDAKHAAEEVEYVNRLTNAIQDVAEGTLSGLLAARRSQGGKYTFYCYLRTSECRGDFQAAPLEGVAIDCQLRVRTDPKWEEYREWLFPHRTMDMMQVFNWEMLKVLRSAGEDLSAPHEVKHFLYLPQGNLFDQFCHWARGAGFALDLSPQMMRPESNEKPLALIRVETDLGFCQLNDTMFAVILEAERLGGRYAECRVISTADLHNASEP